MGGPLDKDRRLTTRIESYTPNLSLEGDRERLRATGTETYGLNLVALTPGNGGILRVSAAKREPDPPTRSERPGST